ncbi:hypothetical protein M422DRAFT_65415 [Sphaerobolus stellatus SS14]|nr:hypothetical protein M422DRAFT_65415 [Sphaerobolus stellatus SS14]
MSSTLISWWTALRTLLILSLALPIHSQQNTTNSTNQFYTAVPRWGQASAVLYNTLFISGGKTDPQHQYTYTSAPNTNDLIALDLSASFDLSSPPWLYLAGAQNQETSQGPAVAFHTLTPYTSSQFLLFGGDSGFQDIQTDANSAWLLNAKNQLAPSWEPQTTNWASEPIRRIYHAAPAASGAVYIIGGQKGDGSQIGFPDTYLFNAVGDNGSPLFVPQTNTTNAPAGLFGHAAHMLPGGQLLVFGGFLSSTNEPSPFSMIYVLDTTSNPPSWSINNQTAGRVPRSRRNFASVLLDDGRIIIHGGADATMQTFYSDGAILDTTKHPMTWTSVDVLADALGPRMGHFAALGNGQVLFGFGWAGNGPANASLACYDINSSTFKPTYTPPTTPPTVTTLPVSPTSPGGVFPSSGAGGSSEDGSNTGASRAGSSPISTSTASGVSGGKKDDGSSEKTGMIVGAVFGVLAVMAAVSGGIYYTLRRRERRAWMGIDADPKRDTGRWKLMPDHDPWGIEDESPLPGPGVQMAAGPWTDTRRQSRGLLGLAGIIGLGTLADRAHRRRDMLADEDTYQYEFGSAFPNEGKGGLSAVPRRPMWQRADTGNTSYRTANWDALWNNSVTSFRNVGTALGIMPSGSDAAREGRGEYVNPPEWWEKTDLSLEPFTDEAVENLPIGGRANAMRPRGGELADSQASNPYVDPFSDNEAEHPLDDDDNEGLLHESRDLAQSDKSLPRIPEGSSLARVLTNSSTEQTGTSSDTHPPSSYYTAHSGGAASGKSLGPLSFNSSLSSPTSPRSTTVFGATTNSAPVRRSDTWWSRLSRAPFLDRHSYDQLHRRKSQGTSSLSEFRDPNPPPRLVPIEETSPQTPEGPSPTNSKIAAGRAKRREGSGDSTKSSVKTGHTANTDRIERLGGRMVVQRALSRSSRRTVSTGTTFEGAENSRQNSQSSKGSHRQSWSTSSDMDPDSMIISPVDGLARAPSPITGIPEVIDENSKMTGQLSGPRPPQSATSAGGVMARIAAYERRMSQDPVAHDGPRPQRKERLSFGFAPKPSLYVANPDGSLSRDSST